jgi:hypothetical protein
MRLEAQRCFRTLPRHRRESAACVRASAGANLVESRGGRGLSYAPRRAGSVRRSERRPCHRGKQGGALSYHADWSRKHGLVVWVRAHTCDGHGPKRPAPRRVYPKAHRKRLEGRRARRCGRAGPTGRRARRRGRRVALTGRLLPPPTAAPLCRRPSAACADCRSWAMEPLIAAAGRFKILTLARKSSAARPSVETWCADSSATAQPWLWLTTSTLCPSGSSTNAP